MTGERRQRLDGFACRDVTGTVATDAVCNSENRWCGAVCVLIVFADDSDVCGRNPS